jgi:hypothetical protein
MIDSWICHICGERRPDEFISVYSKDVSLELGFKKKGLAQQNVRYCNDKKECKDKAITHTFFKKKDNDQ